MSCPFICTHFLLAVAYCQKNALKYETDFDTECKLIRDSHEK